MALERLLQTSPTRCAHSIPFPPLGLFMGNAAPLFWLSRTILPDKRGSVEVIRLGNFVQYAFMNLAE